MSSTIEESSGTRSLRSSGKKHTNIVLDENSTPVKDMRNKLVLNSGKKRNADCLDDSVISSLDTSTGGNQSWYDMTVEEQTGSMPASAASRVKSRHSTGDSFATSGARTSNFERETEIDVLKRRQKQIDYGKNTVGYERYQMLVPRPKREKFHPRSPNKHRKYSRRAWDGIVKKWRIDLHAFDPADAPKPDDIKRTLQSQSNSENLDELPPSLRSFLDDVNKTLLNIKEEFDSEETPKKRGNRDETTGQSSKKKIKTESTVSELKVENVKQELNF